MIVCTSASCNTCCCCCCWDEDDDDDDDEAEALGSLTSVDSTVCDAVLTLMRGGRSVLLDVVHLSSSCGSSVRCWPGSASGLVHDTDFCCWPEPTVTDTVAVMRLYSDD